MRKDLTSEASRWLHRRRGRVLIASSAAVLIVGSALSMGIAVSWRQDRKDAAAKRFRADEQLLESNVRATVSTYIHALQVTRGFFRADRSATRPQFLTFASSLDFKDSTPGLLALESIRANVPSAITGGPDIAYPIDMVAPHSAAVGLLWRDLAYDPSVRRALPLVARRGGVMMMPPRIDVFRHVRMLLVGSVTQDEGSARWVGASIDPAIFATQAIGEVPPGIRASLRWGTDGQVLATAAAPEAAADRPTLLSTSLPIQAEGTDWMLDVTATSEYDPMVVAFPWRPFAAGLVPAIVMALILFILGRSRIEALDMATRLGKDLAASEARAKAVMESAVEAILTTDAVGHVESVNPAAEVLFGWAEAEIVGRPIAVVVPGLELSGEHDGLEDLHWGPRERMVEAIRKDEQRLPVDVSMSPTTIGGREMFTLIARDATLRKLYEDQLEHQATHDPLTGLANRTLFDELLVRAAYRADRSGRPVAVLYLDLDGFKDVNDVFGHPSGDRVLSETSRRLEAVVRPGDMVARMGGDEFVVLCEHLSEPSDVEKIATRIVQAVGKPIPLASGVATVTASVGIALGEPGETAASLVARADEAMYRMKQGGKAGFLFAGAAGG
ncbi:MAG: sensor domain-containing diguanylate cyclase [Actinomycetota bacterium]|nr:sensor domain-containing diguanylate cyclase [Actinomycetota bacterium]